MAIDKKNAKWRQLTEFQKLVVSREKPLAVVVEKQVTSDTKVTVYWSEEATSSLFDEEESYKVSVSLQLAELLIKSGLCVKENKTNNEEEFLEILLKKIAEKNQAVQTQE